jgi:hypothetical protein
MKLISINNVPCRFVAFYDENNVPTEDAAEACTVLYQRLEDVRPDGVKQAFWTVSAPKGTFEMVH